MTIQRRLSDMTDREIADALTAHGINLLRYTAQAQAEIAALLVTMQRELVELLLDNQDAMLGTPRRESQLRRMLQDAADMIGAHYDTIAATMAGNMGEVAAIEGLAVTTAINAGILAVAGEAAERPVISLSHEASARLQKIGADALLFGGPAGDWWKRQGEDTAFRFGLVVRNGIRDGVTTGEIISRVIDTKAGPSVIKQSRAGAASLVQTAIASASNEARQAMFQANSDILDGMMQVSTLDGHTTDVCIAYSGGKWNLKYEPIRGTTLPYNGGTPRHRNCRSTMVPLTKSFKSMGIDLPDLPMTTRASMDGQIDANITFADWLKGKPDSFQNTLLGKGRAEMWRDGTITLRDLLDQSGNPLTLRELRALYE
jgi:hypothetical protein